MTYRLKRLSSLLILLMLLTSKPAYAWEQAIIFALPFVGNMLYDSSKPKTSLEKYGEYSKHNPELDWVPVGHCRKADFIDPTTSSVTHKVVCKQSDGSWKLDNDRWAGRYGGAFLK